MIKHQPRFIEELVPSRIDNVKPGSPADKAGIKASDKIVGFNGKPLSTVNEFNVIRGSMNDVLASASHADSIRLQSATAYVLRAGSHTVDTVNIKLGSDYTLGIQWHLPMLKDYKRVTRHFTVMESIPAGIQHGWNVLSGYVNDLKYLFTADGAKSVGSFGAIGSLFPHSLGLGALLGVDCFHLAHFGFHEYSPDSGIGRWSCILLAIRSYYAQTA